MRTKKGIITSAKMQDTVTVTRYTDRWLRSTLTGAQAGSVEALLARQHQSVRAYNGQP